MGPGKPLEQLGFRARVTFAAFASFASFACSRIPPEPAPASRSNVPAITSVTNAPAAAAAALANKPDAAGRCIAPTPTEAPPLPPPASASACPADPEGIPTLKVMQVGFPDATGNPKLEVELVTTEKEIQRGLMYRRTMPEEHGMLFRLADRSDHTFWMHNTCMPLDMLFVDDDGLIVGIVEGATPLTDTTRSVGCPSSWVLETNAGWVRRHGVRAGQRLGLPAAAR